MNEHARQVDRKRGLPLLLIAFCALVVAGAVWFVRNGKKQPGEKKDDTPAAAENMAPTEVIEPFSVGLSSLDVEENERASRLFDELSRTLPDEPAIWANLGLVRLRLGDLPGAQQALDTAAGQSPGTDAIVLLQATVDERLGQFAQAISRLKEIANPDAVVLYRIAELLGRTGREADPRQQLEVIERILKLEPQNLVAKFQRARLLAKLEDAASLKTAIDALAEHREDWNEAAAKQFESAKAGLEAGNFRVAATHLTFLENLSRPTPPYQAALATLGITGGSVGQPVRRFLKFQEPALAVSDADTALRFEMSPETSLPGQSPALIATPLTEKPGANLVSLSAGNLVVQGGAPLPIPEAAGETLNRHSLCAVDLDADFLQDLAIVGPGGLVILMQQKDNSFTRFAPAEESRPAFEKPGQGVWALDYEADGDLDLLVSAADGSTQLIRNNSDATFTPVDAFPEFRDLRDVLWADLDGDGDDDLALLDTAGRVLVSWNERSGLFLPPVPVLPDVTAASITFGDVRAVGTMELIALDQAGQILRVHPGKEGKGTSETLVKWSPAVEVAGEAAKGRTGVWLADVDNNGAVDIVASVGGETAVWLNRGAEGFHRLEEVPSLLTMSVGDVDGDGSIDLVGLTDGGASIARSKGTKGYHWQSIHTRTLATLADGRINSFGIGGRIEIRAGRLLQSAPIRSPQTHFGLGAESKVGVARIVWPNGVVQAEFDLAPNQTVTAVQRLKGSCPFVFTRDGDTLHFVKDFIWRSPLGMRINSQETAGVEQTKDWIKLPGRLLTERDGVYEVRITADLWETHFFDHISLMAVDHPESVEAFVDERFVPTSQPKLQVISTTAPLPLSEARDEAGRDVLTQLNTIDGVTVDSFPLGRFQGIAEDHWIEFQLPGELMTGHPLFLIGHGWIYPTDSSLNVAISQGAHPAPQGLVLEEQNSDGKWQSVSGDLGFPAGKNKTVVIPLPMERLQAGQRHFRLRTNLEVYWDSLGWAAEAPEAAPRLTPLETHSADLRHRGFSKLSRLDRRKPDIPEYNQLSGINPRWRNLEGLYTRFGDVRELLKDIDDRYLIMNAGDEIVLRFTAIDPPAPGWTRDFVLVGDGWVKDGDFNTAHSQTVHPLPTHDLQDYSSPFRALEEDPVFLKHSDDWRQFHTRFVSPRDFDRGLMQGAEASKGELP